MTNPLETGIEHRDRRRALTREEHGFWAYQAIRYVMGRVVEKLPEEHRDLFEPQADRPFSFSQPIKGRGADLLTLETTALPHGAVLITNPYHTPGAELRGTGDSLGFRIFYTSGMTGDAMEEIALVERRAAGGITEVKAQSRYRLPEDGILRGPNVVTGHLWFGATAGEIGPRSETMRPFIDEVCQTLLG